MSSPGEGARVRGRGQCGGTGDRVPSPSRPARSEMRLAGGAAGGGVPAPYERVARSRSALAVRRTPRPGAKLASGLVKATNVAPPPVACTGEVHRAVGGPGPPEHGHQAGHVIARRPRLVPGPTCGHRGPFGEAARRTRRAPAARPTGPVDVDDVVPQYPLRVVPEQAINDVGGTISIDVVEPLQSPSPCSVEKVRASGGTLTDRLCDFGRNRGAWSRPA